VVAVVVAVELSDDHGSVMPVVVAVEVALVVAVLNSQLRRTPAS